ncbi:MAG: DUF3320 domain-containing protein [Ruminiclostridium sp.]|nr:DUF3320 domain-containing protein [Ruminiclostridium sp.]
MELQKKIDIARRELLDLSLRNPLLNFRTLKKKGLNITDEKSVEIYRLLVDNGKSMSFLSEESLIKEPETGAMEHIESVTTSETETFKSLELAEMPETVTVETMNSVNIASAEKLEASTVETENLESLKLVEMPETDTGESENVENLETVEHPETDTGILKQPALVEKLEASTGSVEQPVLTETGSETNNHLALTATQKTEPTQYIKTIKELKDESQQYLELLNKSYSDLKIQTRYSEKELQERLLNTQHTAKTFIEERGVNTLFIALGMLLWEEEGKSDKKYRAPLILIPVSLTRSNARERFLLTYSNEDIQFNVSLAAKLLNDFHIQIDSEVEELYIEAYFQHIRSAIVSRPSWEVAENEIALGFFSFGKYLMYLDLDSTRWPTDSRFFNNDILKALLVDGFHESQSEISDDAYIDPFIIPKENYQVVDADGSQTLAILDILSERNLVIQGPPGTGKSQTITNIIAECVARGKKVLFVSEKLAALEVVKRRLTNVGLGDVCLELHSQKANKKELLAELQKTMELGVPKTNNIDNRFGEYVKLREELTGYCKYINDPVLPSGLTLIRIYGKLLVLKELSDSNGLQLPRVKIPDIDKLNDIEFETKLQKVKEMQSHVKKMGVPNEHPYRGMSLSMVLPAKKDMIHDKVIKLHAAFENLIFILDELGSRLSFSPNIFNDAKRLAQTLELYAAKPEITGFIVQNPRWENEAEKIKKLVQDGIRTKEIYAKNQNLIMDEIYSQDLLETRRIIASNKGKFLKFLSSDYKNAVKYIEGFFKTPQKVTPDKLLQISDDVLEYSRLKHSIENTMPLYQELFLSHANGYWETNWHHIKAAIDFIIKLHQGISSGSYVSEILPVIHNISVMDSVIQLLPSLLDGLTNFPEALNQFNLEAGMKPGTGINLDSDDFATISEKISGWEGGIESIFDMAAFNQYSDELKKLGLVEIVELSEVWRAAGDFISYVLENERLQSLLAKAYKERPELARFDSMQHKQKIERFNELDLTFMSSNISRILYEHYVNKPKPGNSSQGQVGILLREFQKKSRHMPIRKLITRAGNIIQSLKPVMMMSPLSIANFIEPGQLSFDIVIFDEASQVRPVEAFGALMRSMQAVVVGDSQQMPPSNFFDKTIDAGSNDEDEDYIGDVESILGLFLAQNAPQRMLRWHYRSKHESLIAVSNKEFYKNKLVVFPSCVQDPENMGIVFHYLKDTIYDRGSTQTNQEEAKIVAEHVMRHAKEHPELTLGVAAFSIQQMQAIIDRLEIMRRIDPSAERFFQSHPEEPFFIKNLENVQGDERDIIFISVGYGKDKDGMLTMSFGPLNRDGGERRLNVLITRARQKCEVFSNITGDDIDLNRSQSRGVACLKTFLNFAEKGTMDMPRDTEREAESEFELQVYDKLVEKGYTVHQQVGCADFYIDLSIVHPDEPGKYLLGIECDGASYHSARSSRDRDRLRQAALERKGWNIYRIWSTDWFKSPNTELAKLEQHITKLLEKKDIEKTVDLPEKKPIQIEREEVSLADDEVCLAIDKYAVYQGREINSEQVYQPAFLSRLVYDILNVESPIHKDELIRRVLGLSGLSRAGSKIQNVFDVAINHNIRRGLISESDNFLYCEGKEIKLRSRSDLPAISKKLEYISLEEIAIAIKALLKSTYGMQQHEIPLSVAKVFGFSRTNDDMTERVNAILAELEKTDEIKKQGDTYISA